jgi:hypothetical protein
MKTGISLFFIMIFSTVQTSALPNFELESVPGTLRFSVHCRQASSNPYLYYTNAVIDGHELAVAAGNEAAASKIQNLRSEVSTHFSEVRCRNFEATPSYFKVPCTVKYLYQDTGLRNYTLYEIRDCKSVSPD